MPSRIGYLLDIAPKELENVLYFAASIVTAVDNEKRKSDLADLEDKVRGESERIYVDRDESLAALEQRLARRRDYFTKGKEKNFDEDDEFWGRGLSAWAESRGCRRSRTPAAWSPASSRTSRRSSRPRTEESPRARAPVGHPARPPAPSRELTSRERRHADQRGPAPLYKKADKASGAKKGAITKNINRILDALLEGYDVEEEDTEVVAGIDMKNLEKARGLGKGLLEEVLENIEFDHTPDQSASSRTTSA